MNFMETQLPTVLPTEPINFIESDLFNATFFIIFGIIVNLSNLLIIITVLNFRSLSNPDVLILALAGVDYLSSLVLFPLAVLYYLHPSPNLTIICDIYTTASCGLQMFSTVIITLMTMDRFLAIRKPILYRARLSVPNLRRLIVVFGFACVIIPCVPLILEAFKVAMMPSHTDNGHCFAYHTVFIYIILSWSYIQIPLVVYCFIGFIFYIRQFINHKSQKSFDSIHPNTTAKWYQLFSRCSCNACGDKDEARPPTRREILEKTISMMKHLNLKKLTRMANTLAWIVFIYYVIWTAALVSMTYQLITKDKVPVLNFVVIRLTLLDSILNPVVYASLNSNYRRGFQWTMCYPLRLCGYKRHSRRSALGLTVSEMKSITQRMAIDEWESPGLNRRLHDQNILKIQKSNTSTIRTEEIGFDNPGFDENTTSHKDTISPSRDHTTVITNAIVENPPSSSRSSAHDIPPSFKLKHSQRPNGGAVVQRIDTYASDSGVDVESIQQEGTTSSYSSPATNPRKLTKDRGGSIHSTQSEPVGVSDSNNISTVSYKDTSGNNMHSLRIETFRNTWQSAETLVKIHVDVLESLNESQMLGPYCLQSKIKRSKLRSSDRPPTLKFSVRENRFIARRTSFDDLDAYYLDFSEPIINQISSNITDGKTQTESHLKAQTNKPNTAGLEGPWNTRSMSSNQDDLIIYSQLLMRKHEQSGQKTTEKKTIAISAENNNEESTSL